MDKEKLYEKIKLKQSFEYKGRYYKWCDVHETYEYDDRFGNLIAVNIEDVIDAENTSKEEDIRLDQTKKVFKVLADLIQNKETCSYRYLIYDLLNFDGQYSTLIDGMTITNYLVECDDLQQRMNKAIEYIEENCMYHNENNEKCYFKYGDDLSPKELIDILKGSEE